MSDKFDRLVNLLRELFQLDQPDLDFGLYRIMHAKSGEVTQFLEKDLLPQVKKAFEQYQPADKAAIKKKLDEIVAGIEKARMNPDESPEVQELRKELETGVDLDAMESEVYDHLYSFFRRYYSEGDFLAKRVYKPGVYAVPYEGEEVVLHWANKDQHYIKTSEYLRDYAFRLKPGAGDAGGDPMRVHLRLVAAAEGEHGNNKAAEGKDRVFVLAPAGESGHDFLSVETVDGREELVIGFEYRPATMDDWTAEAKAQATAAAKKKPPKQKNLIDSAVKAVLATTGDAFDGWIGELAKPHSKVNGETAEYSRLEGHLNRYSARHTFDYFIHKDLGGFLRRELDFYIKNEVMHLDDVQNEDAPKVEQYLSKIKVIRSIAGKMIDFLHQLEVFQRRLWTKCRFVVDTQYCLTLDRVPDDLLPEIASNDLQREEWIDQFSIDQQGQVSLGEPSYSAPLTVEYLKANPQLPIDTRHFSDDFRAKLVETCPDLVADTLGLLVHSENECAMRSFRNIYTGCVRCIYIDPPYNTGDDGFLYKDNYQHSSWCCLILDRLAWAKRMLDSTGCICISIDQEEFGLLQTLCDEVFGRRNRLSIISVKRGSVTGHKVINPGVVNISEYVVIYAKDRSEWLGNAVYAERERDARYGSFIENRDSAPESWRFTTLLDAFAKEHGVSKRHLREHFGDTYEEAIVQFVSDHADAVVQLATVNRGGVGTDFLSAVEESEGSPDQVIQHKRDGYPDVFLVGGKKVLFYADKLVHVGDRLVTAERASDIWTDVLPNDLHNEGGVALPKGKKPEALVSRLLELGSDEHELTLDFFAGSGTMPASAQKIGRRWIAVESAEFFDSKTLRRMKNVLAGESRGISAKYGWRGGGMFKYVRLESYEDAISNLALAPANESGMFLKASADDASGRFSEEFRLRYQLEFESRDSVSLLNCDLFIDPTRYRMSIRVPGTDDHRVVCVDLIETFNWLLGLRVAGIAAPKSFSATFNRDGEGRLAVKGRIKEAPDGRWWFRTVTGTTPDGKRALIIWRKRPGGDEPEGIEQDNAVLDAWFRTQKYSTSDSEFDIVWVNGDNNLANLRQDETPDDGLGETGWKVRIIEQDLHRLMFDTSDVPGGA